jgi:hypothetical protein
LPSDVGVDTAEASELPSDIAVDTAKTNAAAALVSDKSADTDIVDGANAVIALAPVESEFPDSVDDILDGNVLPQLFQKAEVDSVKTSRGRKVKLPPYLRDYDMRALYISEHDAVE